ncbi:hypothetical protein AAMO2058_000583200 [Amorphochlora amoebiformis]
MEVQWGLRSSLGWNYIMIWCLVGCHMSVGAMQVKESWASSMDVGGGKALVGPLIFTVGGASDTAEMILAAGGKEFRVLNKRKGSLDLTFNNQYLLKFHGHKSSGTSSSSPLHHKTTPNAKTNPPLNTYQTKAEIRQTTGEPESLPLSVDSSQDGFVTMSNFLESNSASTWRTTNISKTTHSGSSVVFSDVNVNGEWNVVKKPKISNQRQWTLWAHHDFQNNDHGWKATLNSGGAPSPSIRQVCQNNPDVFFGGYCALAGAKASLSLKDLPQAHKLIKIRARVHFFDRWVGETLYLKVNGNVVWTKSHKHCTKVFVDMCRGLNTCGNEKYADTLSYNLEVVVPHVGKVSADIEFGSTLQGNPCEASWGIDDVMFFLL